MFLNVGNRGLLIGKTGSGKTQNAIFQLKNAPVFPVFILDTKIEDHFFSVPDDSQKLVVLNGLEDLIRLTKQKHSKIPDYILVRPLVSEMAVPEMLDKYVQIIYQGFGECFVYFDELYNWHLNGRAQPGLIGLLTRGRSKGKTTLMATQRPSWISRFCFTESDKFYIHHLTDMRDKKTVGEIVPNFAQYPNPPKFHFYHFAHGEHDEALLYRPVPETKIDNTKIFERDWL